MGHFLAGDGGASIHCDSWREAKTILHVGTAMNPSRNPQLQLQLPLVARWPLAPLARPEPPWQHPPGSWLVGCLAFCLSVLTEFRMPCANGRFRNLHSTTSSQGPFQTALSCLLLSLLKCPIRCRLAIRTSGGAGARGALAVFSARVFLWSVRFDFRWGWGRNLAFAAWSSKS